MSKLKRDINQEIDNLRKNISYNTSYERMLYSLRELIDVAQYFASRGVRTSAKNNPTGLEHKHTLTTIGHDLRALYAETSEYGLLLTQSLSQLEKERDALYNATANLTSPIQSETIDS